MLVGYVYLALSYWTLCSSSLHSLLFFVCQNFTTNNISKYLSIADVDGIDICSQIFFC